MEQLFKYIDESEIETLKALVQPDDDLETKVAIGKLIISAQNLLDYQNKRSLPAGRPATHEELTEVARRYAEERRKVLSDVSKRRQEHQAA